MPTSGKVKKAMMHLPTRAGVIMLLLFYLAAFVYSPMGVPHVHHEDEVHHEDSCKNDACHISIYHPGSHGACNHKYHFTETIEDCTLCSIILPRHLVVQPSIFSVAEVKVTTCVLFHLPEVVASTVFLPADRGPPSLI